MSTSYFRFRRPFTSARATAGGGHTQLTLWVNHANAGSITLRNEEVPEVLRVLCEENPAVTSHNKGNDQVGYRYYDDDVEIDTPLVSEYGDLCKLEDLPNQGRAD